MDAGAAASPATLINRVDVVAVVVMLAGLPWLARRVFGPAGGSWLARIVRVGSYAAVFRRGIQEVSALLKDVTVKP